MYCLSDMEEKAVCQVVSILSLYICLIKQQLNCILAIFTLRANVSVYSKYTLGVKFGILVFFFFISPSISVMVIHVIADLVICP